MLTADDIRLLLKLLVRNEDTAVVRLQTKLSAMLEVHVRLATGLEAAKTPWQRYVDESNAIVDTRKEDVR